MAFKIRKALVTTAIVLPGALALALVPPDSGTGRLKPKVSTRAVTTSAPSGYEQVGNTELFYRNSANFDFYGRIGNSYYQSTFGNGGYKLAIQVNSNTAQMINCNQSTTIDGVTCTPRVEQQGEFGRVVYSVYNSNENDAVVSLGTHADVMIGNNDGAPISRRVDMIGATYGVSMKDNGAAQLCVLFGSGLAGVNGVDDFWFGHYSQNNNASAMVGNYTHGSNFMVENGNYDSGMGWCWKNRTVPAGETVEFSYLIGVGDVNLEPTSSFTTTLENIDPWNDLTQVQTITINGEYESPAGQNGRIEYSVEDSEEWSALTDELTSGSEFSTTLSVKFTPYKSNHVIRFRTVDIVGNTTMLNPIVYKDVYYYTLSGVKSLPYNFGEPVYQTDVECALPTEQYKLTNYSNNTEVGTASFKMEGVFPYTNGFKQYTFNITPRELEGEIIVDEGEYVYDKGNSITPSWQWSDERFANLVEGTDYTVSYLDNAYPGTATIRVTGKGNFTGTLEGHFTINKAQLDPRAFSNVPNYWQSEYDEIYDGNPHSFRPNPNSDYVYGPGGHLIRPKHVSINKDDGTIISGDPIEPGDYDLYITVDENPLYIDTDTVKVGEMRISPIDNNDFMAFNALRTAIIERGFDITNGDTSTPLALANSLNSHNHANLCGFSNGRITSLNLSGCGITGSIPAELYELSALTELSLWGCHFEGNVTEITDGLPLLTSLTVNGGNNFSDIYPPLPERLTQFNWGYHDTGVTLDIDLSNINILEIASRIPRIMLYNHDTHSYNSTLTFVPAPNFITKEQRDKYYDEDKRSDMVWDPTFTIDLGNRTASLTTGAGYNIYRGQSGDILNVWTKLDGINNDETYPAARGEGNKLAIKLSFAQGDVNFNGAVEVTDLQMSLNYIFGRLSNTTPFNFTAADLWEDERLNVQDIVLHTNILTNYHPEADNATRRLRSLADNSADAARVYCRDGQLIIDSPTPVAAFDIVVTGNSAQLTSEIRALGFTAATVVKDGYAHIVGYSLSGAEIPAGVHAVADVDGVARAYSCTLSDIDANLIPSIAGQQTGIDGIDNGQSTAIYADGNRLYLTTANGGHCRWSVHTTAGTLIAAGECETVAGTNLLTTLDGINTMAIATVETAGGRIVTKIVAGQYTNH